MINKKITVGVLVGLLILVTVAWIILLKNNIAGKTVQEKEPIKIGAILPLSGSAAYYGQVSQNGIEIARNEIAEKYPELDIKVYYEDSFYTPKGGVDSYNKLRNINKVDAVITAASQVSLAVQPLSKKDGIFQMAIFSSAGKYTTPDDLSFRVSNRNEIEAAKSAEFIKDKDFKKLVIIYLNNDFGVGFKESLEKELIKKETSTKVVSEEGFLLDTADFRTILSKIKGSEADIIFMVGTASHCGIIMKQAREMGINAQFLAMRSAEDPVLLKNFKESSEGLIYTYPFDASSENSEIKSFSDAYKLKYNETPEAYAAEGYEGFKLTALAFEECGKDYACIKNYLENLEDYKSVFGDLKFDENGDVYYDFFLKTIKDGEFVKYA